MTEERDQPAFPIPLDEYGGSSRPRGMTLRQWYAGQALPAIISKSTSAPDDIAMAAFLVADAMLEEGKYS